MMIGHERTAAVLGATGFVGRHVVRELLHRGWRVRGLVRDREKARAVLPRGSESGLSLVAGDAADAASVRELLAGADAAVNAIGIIRERAGQTFQKMHVRVVRVLIDACRAAGVGRLVQVSALGVSDEGTTPYQRTKFEGEQLVRHSGLDWTILRPAMIHGPGGEFVATAQQWARGAAAPWFFLPYFVRGEPDLRVPLGPIIRHVPSVQPVAVEDVAWAVAESLDVEAAIGEVYNLPGGETLTWPQLLRWVRDHTPGAEAELEPVGIPAERAAMIARGAKIVGLGPLLPFDEGMARMGGQDNTASLDKAREDLGFEPVPFRQRFAAYAGHG